MADINELIEFVRARLDEEEFVVQRLDDFDGNEVTGIEVYQETNYPWLKVLAIGKKRALDDIESKRQIVNRCVERAEVFSTGEWDVAEPETGTVAHVLRLLALPYAAHDGYRKHWRLPTATPEHP
ncbi:DUF6221 family protein [Acrocarpospora sp. B8E8]|uniref:DUF6221 family protein n=1 Tax=Acrocarpospora sp. B8E8 TaxID=3153572 RepID=UPI00325E3F2A